LMNSWSLSSSEVSSRIVLLWLLPVDLCFISLEVRFFLLFWCISMHAVFRRNVIGCNVKIHNSLSSALDVEAACAIEMLVRMYISSQCHNLMVC
jgi:hypothetical protein